MSMPSDDRLQRLLGGEHLAGLRKRLRRRFELASPDQASKRFRIGQLTQDEHAALAGLTGRHPRFSGSLQIDLSDVDAALREAGVAASLRAALERLDGPIIHLATERDRVQTLWRGVVDGCNRSDLVSFLQAPAALGLVKRLSGGDPVAAANLCHLVEAVLRALPANGITRAQLAADVLGDAHALDNSRGVATLVLAVWRQLIVPRRQPAGAEGLDEDGIQRELHAETARDTWARAGILVNELARPALFLNLLATDARDHALPAGEPGYLSLRALLRSPPSWDVAGRTVFVCENPNLLAIAADVLGERCAPMVCTDGMPAAAQSRLLSQLTQAGARLRYHGDFDWPGLRIGNQVVREYRADPWRFGVSDYLAAVHSSPRLGHHLKGVEVLASWDEALTSAMRTHGVAIAEEGLAGSLLQDLDVANAD
jgi:uncharacterized protein (TIGR02679 family)